LYLPESLREELKIPLGNLIKDSDPQKEQIIRKTYSEKIVITIGDATSDMLIKMGLVPFLQIVDGKEKRHERDLPLDDSIATKLYCVNPAGELTQESFDTIKKSFNLKPPIRILVDGEEDLLVLPTCILAPENYVIMYGQPNEGLVIVQITTQVREKVQKIVNLMK
tara:strand:+ start:739 stop:1236 length:498 start_codon:yes stop_codon:yes gene_type:complete